MTEWQSMETAPIDRPVDLRVKGKALRCVWEGGFVNGDDENCYCWQTVNEDDPSAPECWTDGVCWEENSDLKRSAQPTGWRES